MAQTVYVLLQYDRDVKKDRPIGVVTKQEWAEQFYQQDTANNDWIPFNLDEVFGLTDQPVQPLEPSPVNHEDIRRTQQGIDDVRRSVEQNNQQMQQMMEKLKSKRTSSSEKEAGRLSRAVLPLALGLGMATGMHAEDKPPVTPHTSIEVEPAPGDSIIDNSGEEPKVIQAPVQPEPETPGVIHPSLQEQQKQKRQPLFASKFLNAKIVDGKRVDGWTGAETGLRRQPDYMEPGSHCKEMNDANEQDKKANTEVEK